MLKKLIPILVFITAILAVLPAAKADWDSDALDYPIARDGLINRSDNTFSFVLNSPNGIPDEPVYAIPRLNPDINLKTGYRMDPVTGEDIGEQLFDPEKVTFSSNGYLSYIGGALSQLQPDTTTYIDNGTESSSEGTNVDMLRNATAKLSLKYNPSFTHQKGAIWYCVSDSTFDSYEALAGSSQCSLYAEKPTFNRGTRKPYVIMRAVSIYDPWFDEMEQLYDTAYGDEEYRVDGWREKYLAMDDFQHKNGGYTEEDVPEHITGLDPHPATEQDRAMWDYPAADAVSLYLDYQVTIRDVIENIMFTVQAQTQVNKPEDGNDDEPLTEPPIYTFIPEEYETPIYTARNEIWCYDYMLDADGPYSIDAFYITLEFAPDYDYEIDFEIIEGSSIGTIDMTDIDAADHAFRFVPHGERTLAGGKKARNYGDVRIRMSIDEIGYTQDIVLHLIKTDVRMVKYIGKDASGNIPGTWDNGIIVDKATGLISDESGEWDISKTSTGEPEIHSIQSLLLYSGESFPLAAVAYVPPDDIPGTPKAPFYMTTGSPSTDTSGSPDKPDEEAGEEDSGSDYEITYQRYQVCFTVYEDSDSKKPVPDVLEFSSGNARRVTVSSGNMEYDILEEVPENTGISWWYDTDDLTITALDKQGVYILSYVISPVNQYGESTFDTGISEGTIRLVISAPVDQVLALTVAGQADDENVAILLPGPVSAAQRKDVMSEDGVEMPSHWFLGAERGAVLDDSVTGTSGSQQRYIGRAYVSFSGCTPSLDNMGMPGEYAADISQVTAGSITSYFTVSNDTVPTDGLENALNAPILSDCMIRGRYGLASFPKITTLDIQDSNGIFTAANTIDGEFDLGPLNTTHFRVSGMSDAGYEIDSFIPPHNIEVMDLNSDDRALVNNIRTDFSWPEESKATLRDIDIGNNSFSSFTLSGFTALEHVAAEGSFGKENTEGDDRYLSIVDTPALEYVEADNTAFEYIIADFKRLGGSQLSSALDSGIETAIRANSSDSLKGVALSGSVGYAELQDNPELSILISSEELAAGNIYSYSASGNPSGGNWIRTVNLGGSNSLSASNTLPIEQRLGFNPEKGAGDSYFRNGLPWNISFLSGSNALESVRLDTVRRFISDDGSAKKAMKDLLVENIQGDASARNDSIPDFSLVDTDDSASFQTMAFGTISAGSEVDVQRAGVPIFSIGDLQGYFDISDSPAVKGIDANAGKVSGKGVINAANTGVTEFNTAGKLSFTDMMLTVPDSITLEAGSSIAVSAIADAAYFTDMLQLTLSSDNPASASVSGTVINAVAQGVAEISVTGYVPGESARPVKTIRVTVIPPVSVTPELVIVDAAGNPVTSMDIDGFDQDTVHNLYVRLYSVSSDGTRTDVTDAQFGSSGAAITEDMKVSWSVSRSGAVMMQPDDRFRQYLGFTSSGADETVTITASFMGVSDSVDVHIIGGDKYDIAISDSSAVFHSEYDSPLTVTARLVNRRTGADEYDDMTEEFLWRIEDNRVATISVSGEYGQYGRIIPTGKGSTRFTVTYDGDDAISGTITVHGLRITVSATSGNVTGNRQFHVGSTATLYDAVTNEKVSASADPGITWDFTYRMRCGGSSTHYAIFQTNSGEKSYRPASGSGSINALEEFTMRTPTSGCSGIAFTVTEVSYGNYVYNVSTRTTAWTGRTNGSPVEAGGAEISRASSVSFEESAMTAPVAHSLSAGGIGYQQGRAASQKGRSSGYTVSAAVDTLILSRCADLESVYIGTSYSQENALIRELWIDGSGAEAISVKGDSSLRMLYSSDAGLSYADIQAPMEYIDISDNILGEGTLKIGGMSYSGHAFSGSLSSWGMPSLDTLIAYGNGLGHRLSHDGFGSEAGSLPFPSFRIGSDADGHRMAVIECTVEELGAGGGESILCSFGALPAAAENGHTHRLSGRGTATDSVLIDYPAGSSETLVQPSLEYGETFWSVRHAVTAEFFPFGE